MGIVLASIVAAAALAWGAIALASTGASSAMMAQMVTSGPEGFSFFLVTWAVMMVAMMFPAAAPMVRTYVQLCVEGEGRGRWVAPRTVVFLSSYVLVWTVFGLGVEGLYFLLSGRIDALGTSGTLGPTIAGALLVVAGLYQLTAPKRLCLNQCRSPVGLILTRLRRGKQGAFLLGMHHAAYCVGCCWALFVVLFAVGVMSIPWMALLSAVIFVEKLTSPTSKVSSAFGLLFIVLGALFVAVPGVGTTAMGI